MSAVNVTAEDGNPEAYEIVNKIDQLITSIHENAAMTDNQEVINALCNGFFSVSSWGKVFRIELWADARFPMDTDLGEDVATIPAVIAGASRAAFAPGAIYYYRQRKKSLSHGSVDYQRLQKNLKASSVMLDKLRSLSPENENRFQMLKLQCDIDGLMEYLRLNPKAARGKSKLFILAQSVDNSGTVDVLTPLLERLVE